MRLPNRRRGGRYGPGGGKPARLRLEKAQARIAEIDAQMVAVEDKRDELLKQQRDLAQGSDPAFSAAVNGLAEALGREDIKQLLRFLDGERKGVLRDLEKQMGSTDAADGGCAAEHDCRHGAGVERGAEAAPEAFLGIAKAHLARRVLGWAPSARVLVTAGLVRRIQPAGSAARFEDRVGDNHHHLICRVCGRVVDVDCAVGSAPCLKAFDDRGYEIDEAEVAYWGRCPDCLALSRAPARADPATGPRRNRRTARSAGLSVSPTRPNTIETGIISKV